MLKTTKPVENNVRNLYANINTVKIILFYFSALCT